MSEQKVLYLSRRQILLGVGAVTLLSSAFVVYRQLGTYPKDKLPLRSLSDKEAAIYRYIGKWLLPPGGPLPGHAGDDETIRRIDTVLVDVPAEKRWLLSAMVMLFEHGTAIDSLGSRSLTQMDTEEGARYLESWAQSRSLIHSQLFVALKSIYSFSYFERPDVIAAMGMKPHCETSS